jgi:hypothetical protein
MNDPGYKRHVAYSYVLILLFSLTFPACFKTKQGSLSYQPLSSQQRAAMQTKELEGDFNTAFSATISVLQDEGWRIDVVDKNSGIIQASSLKSQDIIGPYQDWYAERDSKFRQKLIEEAEDKEIKLLDWTRWQQLTSHIEPWGKNTIRQRITITKNGTLPSNTYSFDYKKGKQKVTTTGGKEQSSVVENPVTYQFLFQLIQRAIFIRQGLTHKQ